MFDLGLNETIYSSSYMVGVDEVGPGVREITLLALLDEGGALTNNDGTRIPQKEINEIQDIAVVWNYDDGGDTNPGDEVGKIAKDKITLKSCSDNRCI